MTTDSYRDRVKAIRERAEWIGREFDRGVSGDELTPLLWELLAEVLRLERLACRTERRLTR